MSKELDLLTGRITPTILRLSAPLMGTTLVQMAYSLIDVLWLGRLGTQAVAAVGTAGFLFWLAEAVSKIPRVGMSVLTAQHYGAGRREDAKADIRNGLQMAIVLGLLYSVAMILGRQQIIGFFGLDPVVHKLAIDYLVIVAAGFVLTFVNPVLSAAYYSIGNSVTPFRINVLGLITNMILDPVFIFGFGPIPGLGVRGAAIATVFAQGLVTALFLSIMLRERDIVYQSKVLSAPNGKLFRRIFQLGLPPAVNAGIHSIAGIVLNKYMAAYGATPVAVYTIGAQVESITWMTGDGLSAGLAAFIGQNYGAKKLERVRGGAKMGLLLICSLGTIATVLFLFFGEEIFRIFIPGDPDAIAMGIYYLWIVSASQILMSIEIGSTGILSGLGETTLPGMIGSVLNLLRIPMAWVFMSIFGVMGVWMSMSASAGLKGIAILFVLRRQTRNLSQKWVLKTENGE